MRERLICWLGQSVCDFGLWILNLGPKDPIDREMYRELITHWKKFEARRKAGTAPGGENG